MKTFLFSLLFLMTFTQVGHTLPQIGEVQPKLTHDVLEGLVNGRPKLFLGDWNSSGAPELPYVPDYEFSYKCQAQMNDNLERGQGSQKYSFYAVAEFTISNSKTFHRVEEMTWFGKKRYSGNKVMDSDDKLPFTIKGSYIAFGLKRGSSVEDDRTFLNIHLEQILPGNLVVMESELAQGLRSFDSLRASARTSVRTTNQKPFPNLTLQIFCDKDR
jgi:hypothetical protein